MSRDNKALSSRLLLEATSVVVLVCGLLGCFGQDPRAQVGKLLNTNIPSSVSEVKFQFKRTNTDSRFGRLWAVLQMPLADVPQMMEFLKAKKVPKTPMGFPESPEALTWWNPPSGEVLANLENIWWSAGGEKDPEPRYVFAVWYEGKLYLYKRGWF